MMRLLRLRGWVVLACLAGAGVQAQAGPVLERIQERRAERAASASSAPDEAATPDAADVADWGGGGSETCADWSRKVNRLQKRAQGKNAGPTPDVPDVAYGPEPLQTLDVFVPQRPTGASLAPVILMVHGGGWCVGDKGGATMTAHKVGRWVPKGLVFVSINYPMVAQGRNALAQAHEVAKAVAFVQAHAAQWGGDGDKLILMGHSAGAHLVSLVNADAQIRQAHSLRPVLGVVSLDAGATNVVTQMPQTYAFLKTRYVEAFGTTPEQWVTASPFHKLDSSAAPWLGVCSTTRKDDPCGQGRAYADKSRGLGVAAQVQPENKSHGQINAELGEPGPYTRGVEAFMRTLDPLLARLLP